MDEELEPIPLRMNIRPDSMLGLQRQAERNAAYWENRAHNAEALMDDIAKCLDMVWSKVFTRVKCGPLVDYEMYRELREFL